MIDMQALVNALNNAGKLQRSSYHLTLGKLIEVLEGKPESMPVESSAGSPGEAESYRGYYSDLAFEPQGKPVSVGELLAECRRVHNTELTGYKGGEFLMDDDVPLWICPYGQGDGWAITDAIEDGDVLTLVVRKPAD